ncbi:MAG: hypothetical protein H7256_04135, partial [Bdellovibrio sp.]|nr:hypothetical protein [Bdellovibrio sp.]
MKILKSLFSIGLQMVIVTFFVATKVQAQQPAFDQPAQPESSIFQYSKKIKIGAELISYRYVEPGLIEHVGLLYGANAQLKWEASEMIFGVIDVSVVAGKLNYNGALCDVETNACSNYSAKTDDVIFRITHRFDFKVTEQFHIFAGPGIRYLFDRGESSGFYTRLGLYLFAPVGVNLQIPLNDDSGLIFDLEYDIFISGSM